MNLYVVFAVVMALVVYPLAVYFFAYLPVRKAIERGEWVH